MGTSSVNSELGVKKREATLESPTQTYEIEDLNNWNPLKFVDGIGMFPTEGDQ